MKINKKITNALSIAIIAMSNPVFAAGTAADTQIDNTALITYSVSKTVQTGIKSSPTGNSTPGEGANDGTPTTFLVDKKIDLLVTSGSGTNVVPGLPAGTATNLEYTFTNQGNSTETFTLTATDDLPTVATTDDFDSTGCNVATITQGGTTSAYGTGVTLDADEQITVQVQCAIPDSDSVVKDGAKTIVELLAETNTPSTTSVNSTSCNTNMGTTGSEACTIDVVYADGIGENDDTAAFNAVSNMTYDDDDNPSTPEVALSGTPYHIPGATITYNVVVTNTASEANLITITDQLDTQNLNYVSCALTGDATSQAPAATTNYCSESGGLIKSDTFTLGNGDPTPTTATLTITATVK